MKKILFISNISNRITNFAIPSILAGQALGYEFHMAANYSEFKDDASKYNVTIHHIDLVRNPLSLKNVKAYKQMLALIKREKFDVIHCNTPIGGILGRLCGKKAKVPKIIYTAHGFHFYKGAPLIKNTIFKWAEMWMARYTDAIITINQEDFLAAQKFKLRNHGKVYYVPGVGIDLEQYQKINIDRDILRKSLSVSLDDFILIAVGRLDKNKNNKVIFEAVAKTDAHLILCGDGKERAMLEKLAQNLGCANRIHFLGNRLDMTELYQTADAFIMASFREGLSRSIMEAMASGLPCIVSKIRGNTDLIEDGKGGYLCEPEDIDGFTKAINTLALDETLRKNMGLCNLETIIQFDINNVKNQIKELYCNEIENNSKVDI